jgi:hypothetical protein
MEQGVWYNNKNMMLLVHGKAPLVMPGQTMLCEAISSIMLDVPVVVLHLMGAEGVLHASIILVS